MINLYEERQKKIANSQSEKKTNKKNRRVGEEEM